MIELRHYQEKVIRESGNAFRAGHNSQVFVMPAGSGKTFTAGFMLKRIVERGGKVAFCCHKDDLITQSYNSFVQLGLDCGIISSKFPKEYNLDAPVQIISIPTFNARMDKLPELKFDFAFFDECHHMGSNTWVKMYHYLTDRGAKVIGLTATPCRLDGKPLGAYFEHMVLGARPQELIAEGSLSTYDYYIPRVLDMTDAKKIGGDYSKKDVKEKFQKSKIMGDIPKTWFKLAKGMKTIGFAPNIEQGQLIAEECEKHGIKCGWLDGRDDKKTRERIISDFADGKINILWNINLFSEGFDLSAQVGRDVPIEAVILCRPTASLSLYIQQVTRALRKKPTTAVILDFVGNATKHGLPDDDFEWSLDGKTKTPRQKDLDEKEIAIAHCTECLKAYEPNLTKCPFCGCEREKTKREYEIEKQHELKKIERIEKQKKDDKKKRMISSLLEAKNRSEAIQKAMDIYSMSNPYKARFFLNARFPKLFNKLP